MAFIKQNKNYLDDELEQNQLLERYNQLKTNLGFNEIQSPNNNYILKLTNISNKLRSENSKQAHAQTYQQSIEQSLNKVPQQHERKNVKEFILNNKSDQLCDNDKYLNQEKKRLERKLLKIKEFEIQKLESQHQENIKRMQMNMKSQFENEIIDMKQKISHVNQILNDYLALKNNYSDLEQQLILTTKENQILREEMQVIKYNHTEIISELQQKINSLENQIQLQAIKPQKLDFSYESLFQIIYILKDKNRLKQPKQINDEENSQNTLKSICVKKSKKNSSFGKQQLLEDNQKLYYLVKNFKEKITLIEKENQILTKQLQKQNLLNQTNLNFNQNNSISMNKQQIQPKSTQEKNSKKYSFNNKKLYEINQKLNNLDDHSRELYSKNKQLKCQLKLISTATMKKKPKRFIAKKKK